jgi:hypothetical protein
MALFSLRKRKKAAAKIEVKTYIYAAPPTPTNKFTSPDNFMRLQVSGNGGFGCSVFGLYGISSYASPAKGGEEALKHYLGDIVQSEIAKNYMHPEKDHQGNRVYVWSVNKGTTSKHAAAIIQRFQQWQTAKVSVNSISGAYKW